MTGANSNGVVREQEWVVNALEWLPDAVVVTNPLGRIVFVNRRAEHLFGYTRGRLVGEFVDLLIADRSRAAQRVQARQRLAQPTDTLPQRGLDLWAVRADGKEFPVVIHSSATPAADEVMLVSTVRDRSEELGILRALENSDAKRKMLFDEMLDGFALFETIFDADGVLSDLRFLEINPSCERHIGLREDVVVGKTVREVLPGVEKNWIDAYSEVAATGRSARVEKYSEALDKYLEISAFRPSMGHLAVVFADVTERKRQELAVHRLKEELEARVVERTADLDAANKELQAFAHSVSHDLRAPLRHVRGFAGLLETHAAAMGAEPKRYARLIVESSELMTDMINRLLELSQTSRTRLCMTRTCLETVVEEARRECMREARGRNVRWMLAAMPEVIADPTLLRLVLVNLLSNAVKFTRKRTEAVIEVGTLPGRRDDVVIFVRDNGAGFDDKHAKRIFQVFRRAHDATDYEGIGVGLANVERIVRRHGGDVWAKSELDSGATFFFSLPTRERSNDGAASDPCPNGVGIGGVS